MNQTIINHDTIKHTNKKFNTAGELYYSKEVPDKPGRKIDEYRKLLIRQKIKFTEKPAPGRRDAVLFEF